MRMKTLSNRLGVVLLGAGIAVGSAAAQEPYASTEPPKIKTPDAGTWMPMPDLFPPGAEMQVLNGDPATGPADFYFKVPPKYTFPWHFHTPIEKLFVDDGPLRYEIRDGETKTIEAGDYIYVPARSPHRVTCTGENPCFFFLTSTGPFDVHVVDENWKTIRSWRASDAAGVPLPSGTRVNR